MFRTLPFFPMPLCPAYGLKSIAFCCISTGEFHFPQKKAAEIAVQTVSEFLQTDTQIEKVIFNVFKQEDLDIYKSILYVDSGNEAEYI